MILAVKVEAITSSALVFFCPGVNVEADDEEDRADWTDWREGP